MATPGGDGSVDSESVKKSGRRVAFDLTHCSSDDEAQSAGPSAEEEATLSYAREQIIRNLAGVEEPSSIDPELWNIGGTEVDLRQRKYRFGGQLWYLRSRAVDAIKVGRRHDIAGRPMNRKAHEHEGGNDDGYWAEVFQLEALIGKILPALMYDPDTGELHPPETTFEMIDTDGSGKVDKHEFNRGLVMCGVVAEDRDLELIWNHLDADGGGDLDVYEMCATLQDLYKEEAFKTRPNKRFRWAVKMIMMSNKVVGQLRDYEMQYYNSAYEVFGLETTAIKGEGVNGHENESDSDVGSSHDSEASDEPGGTRFAFGRARPIPPTTTEPASSSDDESDGNGGLGLFGRSSSGASHESGHGETVVAYREASEQVKASILQLEGSIVGGRQESLEAPHRAVVDGGGVTDGATHGAAEGDGLAGGGGTHRLASETRPGLKLDGSNMYGSGDRLCWNCLLPVMDTHERCPHCSADLFKRACWHCKKPIKLNWKRCKHCGENLPKPRRKKLDYWDPLKYLPKRLSILSFWEFKNEVREMKRQWQKEAERFVQEESTAPKPAIVVKSVLLPFGMNFDRGAKTSCFGGLQLRQNDDGDARLWDPSELFLAPLDAKGRPYTDYRTTRYDIGSRQRKIEKTVAPFVKARDWEQTQHHEIERASSPRSIHFNRSNKHPPQTAPVDPVMSVRVRYKTEENPSEVARVSPENLFESITRDIMSNDDDSPTLQLQRDNVFESDTVRCARKVNSESNFSNDRQSPSFLLRGSALPPGDLNSQWDNLLEWSPYDNERSMISHGQTKAGLWPLKDLLQRAAEYNDRHATKLTNSPLRMREGSAIQRGLAVMGSHDAKESPISSRTTHESCPQTGNTCPDTGETSKSSQKAESTPGDGSAEELVVIQPPKIIVGQRRLRSRRGPGNASLSGTSEVSQVNLPHFEHDPYEFRTVSNISPTFEASTRPDYGSRPTTGGCSVRGGVSPLQSVPVTSATSPRPLPPSSRRSRRSEMSAPRTPRRGWTARDGISRGFSGLGLHGTEPESPKKIAQSSSNWPVLSNVGDGELMHMGVKCKNRDPFSYLATPRRKSRDVRLLAGGFAQAPPATARGHADPARAVGVALTPHAPPQTPRSAASIGPSRPSTQRGQNVFILQDPATHTDYGDGFGACKQVPNLPNPSQSDSGPSSSGQLPQPDALVQNWLVQAQEWGISDLFALFSANISDANAVDSPCDEPSRDAVICPRMQQGGYLACLAFLGLLRPHGQAAAVLKSPRQLSVAQALHVFELVQNSFSTSNDDEFENEVHEWSRGIGKSGLDVAQFEAVLQALYVRISREEKSRNSTIFHDIPPGQVGLDHALRSRQNPVNATTSGSDAMQHLIQSANPTRSIPPNSCKSHEKERSLSFQQEKSQNHRNAQRRKRSTKTELSFGSHSTRAVPNEADRNGRNSQSNSLSRHLGSRGLAIATEGAPAMNSAITSRINDVQDQLVWTVMLEEKACKLPEGKKAMTHMMRALGTPVIPAPPRVGAENAGGRRQKMANMRAWVHQDDKAGKRGTGWRTRESLVYRVA